MSCDFSSKRGTSFAQNPSTNCAALLSAGCDPAPVGSWPGSRRTTKGGLTTNRMPTSKTAATIAIRPRFFFCLAGAAGKRESLITEGIGGEPRTGEEVIAFVMEGWGSVSTANIYTSIVIQSITRSCLFTSVKIVSIVSLRLLCLLKLSLCMYRCNDHQLCQTY